MNRHEKINYLEFPARELESTKRFFSDVFDWAFEDYGAEYTAFSNAGLEGGFLNLIFALPPKTEAHWLFSTAPNWKRLKQK